MDIHLLSSLSEGPTMWGIAISSRSESVLLVIIDMTLWMMLPLQVSQSFKLLLLKMELDSTIKLITKCQVMA
ncbi:MAG: hypothetical protein ACQEW5_22995 [Bacillota bacterium]